MLRSFSPEESRPSAGTPNFYSDSEIDQLERLEELLGTDAATKEAPLRRDVRTLGAILGSVLVSQESRAFFDTVESLRGFAIRRREGGTPPREIASEIVEATRRRTGVSFGQSVCQLLRTDQSRRDQSPQAAPARVRDRSERKAATGHTTRDARAIARRRRRLRTGTRIPVPDRRASRLYRPSHRGRATHPCSSSGAGSPANSSNSDRLPLPPREASTRHSVSRPKSSRSGKPMRFTAAVPRCGMRSTWARLLPRLADRRNSATLRRDRGCICSGVRRQDRSARPPLLRPLWFVDRGRSRR